VARRAGRCALLRLDVIVTSYNSPELLKRCLKSLAGQREVEAVIVADCSDQDPAPALSPCFQGVRFLHFSGKRTVPQLRWAALSHSQGDLVAALEARCVPHESWAGRILRAHAQHPDVPAVGGPVSVAPGASAFDLGLYYCEYGLYAPPVLEGPSPDLSGANLSYKRSWLIREVDLLSKGCWETLFHLRWRSQGRRLWMSDAEVVFWNSMRPAVALRQRFSYGRGYAAARFGQANRWWALLALALPAVLTARIAVRAFRRGHARSFLRSLGWLLILNAAWAMGESTGYWTGTSGDSAIF